MEGSMRSIHAIAPRCISIAGALILLGCLGAPAEEVVGDLYQARVRVTGMEEPERSRGFARALSDVLVKLTGDATLNRDPAVVSLAAKAGTMVAAFQYRDLMAGIPLHDEQGTRQRPFVLSVD